MWKIFTSTFSLLKSSSQKLLTFLKDCFSRRTWFRICLACSYLSFKFLVSCMRLAISTSVQRMYSVPYSCKNDPIIGLAEKLKFPIVKLDDPSKIWKRRKIVQSLHGMHHRVDQPFQFGQCFPVLADFRARNKRRLLESPCFWWNL